MSSLNLVDIAKSYGRKTVLNDVTVAFPIGLTLLVGPSGAGKSTLLRLIATAERPSRGEMSWQGATLPQARAALRRTLGYAPQAVDLPDDLTAQEFALHMAALKGLDRPGSAKQFGAITDAIGLHGDINNRIATFSGGMRRRLIFAQALLGAPRLLALDEPTAELDTDTARKVGALIVEQARSAAVVMTTHLADELTPHAVAVLRVEAGRVTPA
ncbi:ATP-binding cassette domain-containing protein [Sphingomonas sp. 28-63-12]|uniref:ATP-binding cassette domain-containing protein n=1 Tax=Sphingomonas sp. 28-63-12 TaxID=1970434 RepID=UPI000BCD75DE|nr:MAG: ABC transporter ATP-binding protein [Sphingomonas sp. 28-63-12]